MLVKPFMICFMLLIAIATAQNSSNNVDELTCPFASIRQLSIEDVANHSVQYQSHGQFIISSSTELLVDDYFSSHIVPNKGKFSLNSDFLFTGFATEGVDYAANIYYVSNFTIVIISNRTGIENLNKEFTVTTADEVYFPLYPLVPSHRITFTINDFVVPPGQGYYWRTRWFGCKASDAVKLPEPEVIISTITVAPVCSPQDDVTVPTPIPSPTITPLTSSDEHSPSTNILTQLTKTLTQLIQQSSTVVTMNSDTMPSTGAGIEVSGTPSQSAIVIPVTIRPSDMADVSSAIRVLTTVTIVTSTITTTTTTRVIVTPSAADCSHIDNRSMSAAGAVVSQGTGIMVLVGVAAPLLVLVLILSVALIMAIMYNYRKRNSYAEQKRFRSGTVNELHNETLYGRSNTRSNSYSPNPISRNSTDINKDTDDMVMNEMYQSGRSTTMLIDSVKESLKNDNNGDINEPRYSCVVDSDPASLKMSSAYHCTNPIAINTSASSINNNGEMDSAYSFIS